MIDSLGISAGANPEEAVRRLAAGSELKTTVGRRVSLLFANLHINGLANPSLHKRILGFEFDYGNYLCVQDSTRDFYYVFYDTALAMAEGELISRRSGNLSFAKEVLERCISTGEAAIEFAKGIEATDLRGKSKAELLMLFGEYVDRVCAIMPITVITVSLELNVEKALRESLSRSIMDKGKLDQVMMTLTAPTKQNVPYLEQVSMLRLAERLQEGRDISKELDEHERKYSWLGYRFDFGRLWTREEILERAKSIKEPGSQLRFLEGKEAQTTEAFSSAAKSYGLGPDIVEQAMAAKEFVWLRTYRTDAINEALGRAKPLIDEIGRRYGIPEACAHYLTIDEIVSGSIPDMRSIEKRMERFALAFVGSSNGLLFCGGDVERLRAFAESDLLGLETHNREIKGMVASRPVLSITGVARVVNSVQDVSRVKPGDILIAPMTEPNFVPAMERAAAFVTDEGGLLCHAAIISREMNKPCIIGTGKATKLIADGDTVELDLAQGIVSVKRSGRAEP
ncbi:MAG: hypothetical protein KGH98_03155 [Candidatus Micrarchaeota archaeon]|nr:hypothetical protein [Candidatus Micrarchaeota archaeon]